MRVHHTASGCPSQVVPYDRNTETQVGFIYTKPVMYEGIKGIKTYQWRVKLQWQLAVIGSPESEAL